MITKIESNEQYHKSSAISASGLKEIHLSSIWHFNRKIYRESDAMNLGSAIHTILLEPENFKKEYAFKPKDARRNTKEGKIIWEEFESKNKGKTILTPDHKIIIDNVLSRFNDDNDRINTCKSYLKGKIELSHYLKYQGIDVRVRPDCLGNDFISDIKTISASYKPVTIKTFSNEVWNRAYHLQAVFYCDMIGIDPENFKFVVIETKAPYTVFTYTMTPDQIDSGRLAYQEAFEKWMRFLETGEEDFFSENLLFDGTYSL